MVKDIKEIILLINSKIKDSYLQTLNLYNKFNSIE